MSESPIEKLMKTNQNLEVWWDSSPLIFERWVRQMVQSAKSAELKRRNWKPN